MKPYQRLVLIISIMASFVAFLDGSVVNVALPAIVRDLGGGLSVQQWVVDGYLITLGALMLLAGSLSDLFGRKPILMAGLIGFGITSLACTVAPTSGFLIASRILQGVAGALLVPSSLALIISAFSGKEQAKAIGTWTGWTGISFIVGPLLGGFLVDAVSWRLVFAINVIPIAITLRLLQRLPVPKHAAAPVKLDWAGAVLCSFGLGGAVFALIEQPHYGWGSPLIYIPLVAGLILLLAFIRNESRMAEPMLPLDLFRVRNFAVGNLATTAIYAGLSVATFLVVIYAQQVGGYSALEAGLALLPVTVIMFFLSPRWGALAGKYGPRWFMALGPVIAGFGFLLMLRIGQSVNYVTALLPAVLLFGLGLSITVAPLTAAVLGSIEPKHAGIGSAINNAIARVAGLIAIASIGAITGAKLDPAGFHRGVLVMAVLLFIGGAVSAVGIRTAALRAAPASDA